MRRALLLVLTIGVVTAVAMISLARPERETAPAPTSGELPKFTAASEAKNPWTSLTPNAAPEQFQFAIVTDRAGGRRAGVFSRAVQQVNLLQPEFVLSVGDLIEGKPTPEGNIAEWDEFDGYVKQFQMPFFYCPGNHDALSAVKLTVYMERYGRPYYHFLYKNCLFVVLNSNDAVGINDKGEATFRGSRIGKDQRTWLEGVLKENAAARWTFVFLHHPIWGETNFSESGWLECEKLLAGRKHNVYAGHVHNFRMFPRNGTNYYQLATTGGGSAMRGTEYGEFDQIAWITMKADGPVMANINLAGVLTHDLSPIESQETGVPIGGDPKLFGEVAGKVTFDGKAPPPGLQIFFTEIRPNANEDPGKTGSARTNAVSGNSRLDADGRYTVLSSRPAKGLKEGRYAVTFGVAPRLVVTKEPVDNPVPEKYHSISKTPLRVTVKKGEMNTYDFNVESK